VVQDCLELLNNLLRANVVRAGCMSGACGWVAAGATGQPATRQRGGCWVRQWGVLAVAPLASVSTACHSTQARRRPASPFWGRGTPCGNTAPSPHLPQARRPTSACSGRWATWGSCATSFLLPPLPWRSCRRCRTASILSKVRGAWWWCCCSARRAGRGHCCKRAHTPRYGRGREGCQGRGESGS